MPSVTNKLIVLRVFMLSVVMLNVIVLNVIVLNVVAPMKQAKKNKSIFKRAEH
jgi:hypothetical protein